MVSKTEFTVLKLMYFFVGRTENRHQKEEFVNISSSLLK